VTRKDYIIIAGVLRHAYSTSLDVYTHANPQAVQEMANAFACALAKDNPRFSREHFLAVALGQKGLHSHPSRNGVQS
jgi:hypothetical protein